VAALSEHVALRLFRSCYADETVPGSADRRAVARALLRRQRAQRQVTVLLGTMHGMESAIIEAHRQAALAAPSRLEDVVYGHASCTSAAMAQDSAAGLSVDRAQIAAVAAAFSPALAKHVQGMLDEESPTLRLPAAVLIQHVQQALERHDAALIAIAAYVDEHL
jgi:hypothetical protein